jgi:hypothetical protein
MRGNQSRIGHCSVADCGRAILARGLCGKHYQRVAAHGSADARPVHNKGRNAAPATFWAQTASCGNCIEWTSYRNKLGYGRLAVNRKVTYAHRHAWTLANGAIPDGLCVLHKCDNPPCCNPSHLFLGTKRDNAQDMIRKGRDRRCRGIANHKAKLSEYSVRDIRDEYARGASQASLARIYGVNYRNIHAIVHRITWTHI